MCSRSQNTAPPSEFAPATLFVPSGWSPPHPPPLPEANFYTRQPCQKFAPISELNCQDGRGSGTLGRWYKAIVRWNDVWLVRPLVRMCTQSFCNQAPPLNCRQFLRPLAMSPSPVSLKLCINAICNDTSPMTNNLIAKNYNNNNHILPLIIFNLGGNGKKCYWMFWLLYLGSYSLTPFSCAHNWCLCGCYSQHV